MKKILGFFCLLSLVFISAAMGQGTTMTIGSLAAPAAGPVSLPITVTSFTNVGAITLKIAYDPTVATFNNVTSEVTGVTFTASAANGVISIGWFDATGTTPVNIATGPLVNLNFTYIGGNCSVAFNTAQCELANSSSAVITGVTYQGGNIGTATATTMTIGSVVTPVAGAIALPISVTNFNNVGAISLKIAYDPTVATFNNVTSEVTGVTFTASAANGVISIGWFDATGTTPVNIATGALVNLNFTYISGNSSVAFNAAQCQLANSSSSVIGGVTYQGGTIGAAATTTMTIGSVAAPVAGSIAVPINVTNFNNVGAITLKIAYDPTVMTFSGVTSSVTGVTFSASAASGVISVGWYDATGTTPASIGSAMLLNLNFTYISGTGAVAFKTAQCELANSLNSVISGVTYQNGQIGATITIALGTVVTPAANSTFSAPINVTNFNNVGAITLKIAYDPSVATFNNVTSAVAGVTFIANAVNGVINLGWFDATGTTPINIGTAKLVDLNFTYLNGTGSFSFNTAQCEIANAASQPISGIVYTSGSLISQLSVKVKVFLQGPFSSGTMSTALATAGYLPLAQPYTVAPFTYAGSEAVANAAVFTTNSIVDWVLVELRSTATGTATARKAALLKNDGTIVGVDGITAGVGFSSVTPGSYFIVIKHRNHLAIMSAAAVALPNASAYDFTTAQTQAYGTQPLATLSTGFGMYMGDANSDGVVKYNLANNDKLLIYIRIGSAGFNATVSGYYNEDINLDGVVKYNLANNDKLLIYNVIGSAGFNATVSTQVP